MVKPWNEVEDYSQVWDKLVKPEPKEEKKEAKKPAKKAAKKEK